MRHLLAIVTGLVLLLGAAAARAGDLRITTADGTPWARLVEQIQEEVESQGKVYRIAVHDGEVRVGCDEYELSFDRVAATAFHVESCDRTDGSTLLRLAHREALFEPGEIVPHARTAAIHATIVRRGSAEGGGAPPQAGSKLWCSVALQPYLWDALHGQPVPLTPDRFVLRPLDAHIQAAADGAGWIARGESRFALRFHYEVVDIHTGSKVLENDASLVCADTPTGRPSEANSSTGGDAPKPEEAPAPSGDGQPQVELPPTPPQPWSAALDIPVPFTATAVGSLLIRPLHDVVFPDGTRATQLYHGDTMGIWGGSTFGFTYQRGMLVIPARLTLAGDAHALAISGLAGAGLAATVGAETILFASPALRFTTLRNFNAGSFSRFDPAMLFGMRHHLWMQGCHGGWDIFAETGVPLGGTGAWLVSAGITQSWGPGSGYFLKGCSSSSKSRKH
jgi:hypothetical protein